MNKHIANLLSDKYQKYIEQAKDEFLIKKILEII
jgi:hypothetical protein